MDKEQALKGCRVEGNVVKLPDVQLDRKVYGEVKKALELIGGKWKGGKVAGFVFASDPSELLASVQGGDKRNLKKEYQFFATPPELADHLVELAGNLGEFNTVLEPSAGQGAIVDALARKGFCIIECFELMETNRLILSKNTSAKIIGDDFLKSEGRGEYDLIIANPPFSKNQDIDHFYHMVSHLARGGRIVSVMSAHWITSKNKKETAFRQFLANNEVEIYDIDPGTFKTSGTMVGAKIVVFERKEHLFHA